MMRSLYSGVSGLKNHQTRMDVIGNNISNVNTAGYKTSRVIFQDVYSQMTSGASAPNGTIAGGTNPSQIGLGVNLSAIDIVHSSAATARTDRELDFAIEGDGYFVVQMPTGQFLYTRAGNFYLDEAGNLVTGDGNFVMGLQQKSYVIKIGDPTAVPPIDDAIVVDASEAPIDGEGSAAGVTAGAFVDAGGGVYTLTVGHKIVKGIDPALFELKDDTLAVTAGKYALSNISDTLKLDAMNKNTMSILNITGYTAVAVDEKGVISGLNAEMERETIGILTIATFTNTGGLEKKGNNLYSDTVNTGAPVYTQAQVGAAGKINPGGLEMSNVDLSSEFTDMIITQRGFQANSRVITVSDTLLEELINLKR